MATHSSILTWRTPWTEEPGGLPVHRVSNSWTQVKWLSTHEHHILTRLTDCSGEGNGTPLQHSCLEIPGTGEPGGLPSMGPHRVGHDWSDLAAAAAALTPHHHLWGLSLFPFCRWEKYSPEGYVTYPGLRDLSRVTRLIQSYVTYPRLLSLVISARNFNFKLMLLIFASLTGAVGCNQRKMVNAWGEILII